MITMHGLVMVFGAIMPSFVGLANWMILMMIGAPDMALPRMNNFRFVAAVCVPTISVYFIYGAVRQLWLTFYAPLFTTSRASVGHVFIFAIHIMGASSIMGSVNIIATVLNMRAPGMTLMKMPMFCWTLVDYGILLIAVMPVLAGAVTAP